MGVGKLCAEGVLEMLAGRWAELRVDSLIYFFLRRGAKELYIFFSLKGLPFKPKFLAQAWPINEMMRPA